MPGDVPPESERINTNHEVAPVSQELATNKVTTDVSALRTRPAVGAAAVHGAEQEHAPGMYTEGGFMVNQTPDGLRLYRPRSQVNTPGVLSLRVGTSRYSHKPTLQLLVRDRNYPDRIAALEYDMGGASQTSVDDTAAREDLQQLQHTPIEDCLTAAGFERTDSQDPAKDIYRFLRQDPNDDSKQTEMLAVVVPDSPDGPRLEAFYDPVAGYGTDDLVKKSHIIGAGVSYDDLNRIEVPELRLSDGAMEYTLRTDGAPIPRNTKIIRELTSEELGVHPVEQQTEATGFITGGVNATELILRMPTLTGMRFDELTARMQPGAISEAGFLGPHDDLRATLARDNELVLAAGFTHQELADPLKKLASSTKLGVQDMTFNIAGHWYKVDTTASQGAQESPLNDNLNGSNNYTITNVETGMSVATSSLGMLLGERYGFYQGAGTEYRTPPEGIIRTFAHLRAKVDNERLQQIIREADRLLA